MHKMLRRGVAERGASCQGGFTLVELLVAIAVLAILLAIAAPNFAILMNKVRLNSVSSALITSLQQARSDAIRLNRRVLVCASNAARTDCSGATNWGTNGWLACYDEDANSACDANTAALPNPIRVENTVKATVATVTGPAAPVRFNPTGSSGNLGSATVTITVTGASGATHTVDIAATGTIKGNRP